MTFNPYFNFCNTQLTHGNSPIKNNCCIFNGSIISDHTPIFDFENNIFTFNIAGASDSIKLDECKPGTIINNRDRLSFIFSNIKYLLLNGISNYIFLQEVPDKYLEVYINNFMLSGLNTWFGYTFLKCSYNNILFSIFPLDFHIKQINLGNYNRILIDEFDSTMIINCKFPLTIHKNYDIILINLKIFIIEKFLEKYFADVKKPKQYQIIIGGDFNNLLFNIKSLIDNLEPFSKITGTINNFIIVITIIKYYIDLKPLKNKLKKLKESLHNLTMKTIDIPLMVEPLKSGPLQSNSPQSEFIPVIDVCTTKKSSHENVDSSLKTDYNKPIEETFISDSDNVKKLSLDTFESKLLFDVDYIIESFLIFKLLIIFGTILDEIKILKFKNDLTTYISEYEEKYKDSIIDSFSKIIIIYFIIKFFGKITEKSKEFKLCHNSIILEIEINYAQENTPMFNELPEYYKEELYSYINEFITLDLLNQLIIKEIYTSDDSKNFKLNTIDIYFSYEGFYYSFIDLKYFDIMQKIINYININEVLTTKINKLTNSNKQELIDFFIQLIFHFNIKLSDENKFIKLSYENKFIKKYLKYKTKYEKLKIYKLNI